MTMHIRVAIADDHPIIRLAIVKSLTHPAIEITGEAGNVQELFELLESQACDVAVVDLVMPGTPEVGNGIDLIRTLSVRHPDVRLVVLTGLEAAPLVQTLNQAGASRVVSKRDELSAVSAAVFAAYGGRPYLSPTLPSKLKKAAGIADLSPREQTVLRLFAAGTCVNDIAAQLGRSKQAISTHKKNGMRKLGLSNDAELYHYARDLGLIE